MGNSEVGHTNIGAGRVVWMDLPRIDNAIADGSFATNAALAAVRRGAEGERRHGAPRRARLAGRRARAPAADRRRGGGDRGCRACRWRCMPSSTAATCRRRARWRRSRRSRRRCRDGARIATVSGRFYAMDRDKRWERVGQAVAAILHAEGEHAATAAAAIEAAYERGETDEFVLPTVIGDYRGAADGDGLFFANFRADRARQILEALVDPKFDGFEVVGRPKWAAALGMVQYSETLDALMPAMFPSADIVNTLGAWVAGKGLKQFRVAETEKYPHVTFFLNGGVEEPAEGEVRYMAPSPKVRTYDLQPEMSAARGDRAPGRGDPLGGVCADRGQLRQPRHGGAYRRAGGGDRGGRGGGRAASGRCWRRCEEMGGAIIVTADHGNCEVMIDPETGGPHTAHTLNPVPVILVGGPAGARLRDGRLSDLAPTLLELMGLDQPPEMDGRSLIVR